jgi:hypothetical protein
MPGPDEEFTVSEPLGERLGRLAARMLKHLRQATCPVLPSARGSPRAYGRPAAAAIDSVADIDILEAAPLNAGRCVVIGENLSVITDPKSGGNSALLPVAPSIKHAGPAVFRCRIDLLEGLVGVSAVTADYRMIAERVPTRLGSQWLEIIVPDLQNVAGILVRNGAITGRPSRANFSAISADVYPAEKLLLIQQDRRPCELRLPLRSYADGGPSQDIGKSVVTPVTLDTAAAAAIIIDAWDVTESRMERNIADRLVPTLAALRSAGMAIIHAPHDRSIHPLVRPIEGETVIPGEFMDGDLIARMLRDAGIEHLFYLGYFSNVCILQRSLGMLEMQKKGFNTTLVRDVSIAKETDESIAAEWFHRAAVHFVEINFGTTVTAAEIQAAVGEACSPGDE